LRIINGGLRLEARDGGRGVLVLKSVSGEEIAIERSPGQLAELQSAIGALATAAEEAAEAKRAEQEAEAKAEQEALAKAEQEAAVVAAETRPAEPAAS